MVSTTVPCTAAPTPRALIEVLEVLGEGFAAVNAGWRFTYINAQAERMYQSPRERLLGNDFWQTFPSALGTAFENEYRRAMATRTEGRIEAPFPRLGAWLDVKIVPQDDGGLAFYFSDVTQRRCAEHHLACQKQLHQLIFAGASCGRLLALLAHTIESISIQPVLASIMVMHSATARLRVGASPSLPARFNDATDGIPIDADGAPWAVAAYTQRTVVVENIDEHALYCFRKLALSCGLRSCWSTPIISPQGRLLGTFSLFCRDSGVLSAAEEEAALVLACLAGMLIPHYLGQGSQSKRTLPSHGASKA